MNSEPHPEPHKDQREERLAAVLADLSDRYAQGENIRLAHVESEHPEFAEDLRGLWAAVMLADAVGSQATVSHENGAAADDVAAGILELPYQFGDYQLLEELGRGGMGVVYRARQISLRREVAVKMLLRGQLASTDDEARFIQEAESAGRLNHPGIVPVYEINKLDGRLYFSMERIEGQTLGQMLEQGPVSDRQAAEILLRVSRAVHFAHECGVLHRDLKPSNILIDLDGKPHISDFGLARHETDAATLTRTGAVLGTPAYMSPEQAAGNRGRVGPASDVYSLGSILYHMLTGRPPFQAESPVDVVLMVLEQEPPPPRNLNPRVARDLSMIAQRCLQKPADLRYDTAAALADDLNAFLNDEPVSARSGQMRHVIARWFRETHHAPILQNWGLLWMWHSLVILIVCLLTNGLQAYGDHNRVHYFLLWTVGLGTWAFVFWRVRQWMGPVTFIERQIAHLWGGSMVSVALLFPIEFILGLPVLTLSPMLALSSGMVFTVKGAMLSGSFYGQAIALFASALAMAQWPQISHLIFGVVGGLSFFLPGWKYYHQRRQLVVTR